MCKEKLDIELKVSATSQEHTKELDKLNVNVRELEEQLEQAKSNCSAAHMSLATIVASKEKLAKENEELTKICEELMATLETQNKG